MWGNVEIAGRVVVVVMMMMIVGDPTVVGLLRSN